MPEILTESFCERCGTRYTFESAAPRGARLKGLRVVSRGLKNFVLSDDTSMDEAMAAARSETDREVSSQQLDAFHKTFNFCMSCRQYTCGNCWNDADGRCLSCAPNLGHEILAAPFPQLDASGTLISNGNHGNGHGHGSAAPSVSAPPAAETMAWPTSDLFRDDDLPAEDQVASGITAADDAGRTDLLARLGGLDLVDETDAAEPSPEAIGAEPTGEVAWAAPADTMPTTVLEPAAAGSDAAEAVVSEPFVEEASAEPPDIEVATVEPAETIPAMADNDDVAASASAQTSDLLRRFRPGQSLDDAIAEFEREQSAVVQPETEAEIVAPAPEPEPEPAVVVPEPEPAPVAPEPEPEPAPVAPEPEPAAVVAPAPEPEPEPAVVVPEPEPEPVAAAAPELAPEPVAPRVDVVPQPTWQVVAPDSSTADGTAPPTQPAAPVAPVSDQLAASGEPQWPARPEWPASTQASASGLPFLGRPAAPTGGIEALWAESAREVASAPVETTRATGVQPCVSCGLSLSANARFCRRCGNRQG
jgi:ribosomal protein L40E